MPIPLLATKLYVPPLRPEWVPRQRLLDRLESGLRRKLTVVSAPAGFGKTTLLSEWHGSPRDRGPSFAWVLLDEQDNEPVRFWSYVLAALERVRPGSGETPGLCFRACQRPARRRSVIGAGCCKAS
jgi:LuxR family maltose regulon positive regulatory protein